MTAPFQVRGDLAAFNAAPDDELAPLVATCADVPTWVAGVLSGRPYADVDGLLRRADRLARQWDDGDVHRALAHHPRIGERPPGDGRGAALSRREQSGVTPDGELAARLVAGNRAYEERFGRVFLVRASGRSGQEVLGLLEQRLRHDDATEWQVTRDQLREIALLRLRGLVAG